MKVIKTKMLVALTVMMLTVGIADAQQKHDYVDLGLPSGTLWATCNVGANSPEECGDYFAWGETTTKSNYDWSTLKYCEDSTGIKFSKYITRSKYGSVDYKNVLDRSDDAATANWGSDWCMPTQAQFQELYDKCNWTLTFTDGKNGFEVQGPNGNTIFFPAAGERVGTDRNLVGDYGVYWSSSLYASNPLYAWYFCFNIGYADADYRDERYHGRSVRPVRCR